MTVAVEKPESDVALVVLDRPDALNAINFEMRRDLTAALREVADDPAVRVVVLTGAGRGFCAGADLRDSSAVGRVEEVLNTEYAPFLSLLQTMDKPVIAAINGPAAGIGVALALSCDLRVMAEDAYLTLAFSTIGLVPDGGLSWLLTREIGYARAYQLAVEAERLDAARCLDWGLVNKKAPPGEVRQAAIDWARALAARAPVAMALTKRAFRAAAQGGLQDAMAFEASLQQKAAATEDCAEGVAALLQKRKPVFKGR